MIPKSKKELIDFVLTAAFLYGARTLPTKAFNYIKNKAYTTVIINSQDNSVEYKHIEWFVEGRKKYSSNFNFTLERSLTENKLNKNYNTNLILCPNQGSFKFKYKNIVIKCSKYRIMHDKINVKYISFTISSKYKYILSEMFNEIANYYYNNNNKIKIFLSHNGTWNYLSDKEKRSLESIFVPLELKNNIIKDIQNFLSSKKNYLKKGIPYQRGYLFCGPPGTGKSSFIHAIASYFSRPLYIMDLAAMTNSDLISSMLGLPENAILVIEDIDSMPVSNDRIESKQNDKNNKLLALSLSTLLNVLDGPMAKEGRLLIMTSNYPEKLDKALIRSGRIDKIINLGYMDQDIITQMCNVFLEDSEKAKEFANKLIDRKDLTAAELQEKLLKECA